MLKYTFTFYILLFAFCGNASIGDSLYLKAQEAYVDGNFDEAVKMALSSAEAYSNASGPAEDWIAARLFAASSAQRSDNFTLLQIKEMLETTYQNAPVEKENPLLGRISLYQGWFLSERMADFHNAKIAYEDAMQRLDKASEDLPVTPYPGYEIYKPLAQIFTRLGESEKATALLEKAVASMKTNEKAYYLPELYVDWGLIYRDLGDHEKALQMYEKGLAEFNEYWQSPPSAPQALDSYKNTKGYLLSSKASALFDLGELIEAKSISKKALRLLSWEDYRAASLGTLAQISSALKDDRKAAIYLELAITNATQFFPPYSRTIAKYEISLSDLQLKDQKYVQALETAQTALSRLLPNIDASDPFQSPNKADFYPENTIMGALEQKGRIFYEWYKDDEVGEIEYLMQAKEHYALAIAMENVLNDIYTYQSSLLTMAAQSHDRHEIIIEILYKLYEENKEEKYLNEAFEYMESSRAVALNRALANDQAIQQLNDESLFAKEQALQIQLADYQRLLFELEYEGASEGQITAVKNEVFSLKASYDSLILELEKAYPEYHAMKYDKSKAGIADIQKQLDENGIFIEYFIGSDALYIFSINGNGVKHFIRQELPDQFSDDLNAFLSKLRDWKFIQNNEGAPEVFAAFTKEAHDYYNLLIPAPIRTPNTERIILIPDGVLNFLPFDILLTSPYTNNEIAYDQLPYLIKSTSIQYAFSGSTLTLNQKSLPKRGLKNYLGIAPEYQNSDYLSEVENNLNAVQTLKKKLGGNLLLGEEASIELFKEKVAQYKIIHFYGHAKAYPDKPQASWLAFSGDPTTASRPLAANTKAIKGLLGSDLTDVPLEEMDRLLFLFELYQLELNADLAVLSACETGIGKIAVGEGVISLARAFSYAGCPSTLMSLWEANDHRGEVAFLIDNFFENLKEGMAKDEAIRQAKLSYLNSPGKSFYPAYWASFVLIGDNQPVAFQSSNHTWWIVGGLGLGLILILLYFTFLKKVK